MSWIEKLADWFGLEALRPHGPAEVDEVGVRRRLRDGSLEEVRWAELEAVMVHTTDEGPFCEDFYWVLFGADGSGVLVPGERAQEIGLLPILQARLPGIDNEAIIAASCCLEEQWFPVWKKDRESNEEAAVS